MFCIFYAKITRININHNKEKKKNTDAHTIFGHKFLPVIHNACVLYCHILLQ